MKLIGANMMGNKFILALYIGLSCSLSFAETNILWDFGVVINSPDYKNISKNYLLQAPSKQKKPRVKINRLISDSFIPPVKSSFSSHLEALDSEKSIFLVDSEAKKCYLRKNYIRVIKILQLRDLSILNQQNQYNLEYLLADALHQTGKYQTARDYVLSLLKHNETERLYFLLAMIYESLEQNDDAREYYLKLIEQYPESDYTVSAHIKSRILD